MSKTKKGSALGPRAANAFVVFHIDPSGRKVTFAHRQVTLATQPADLADLATREPKRTDAN